MSQGQYQGAPIFPQTFSEAHPQASVDLRDFHTAPLFQTLLPSLSPNRVDLVTYFVKTSPKPRSNEFMRNLLKYSELMTEIRAFESALLQRRFALHDVELRLLAEESQLVTSRGEEAVLNVELVRETGKLNNPEFPGPGLYMLQPIGVSFDAMVEIASNSIRYNHSSVPKIPVVSTMAVA